MKKLVEKQNKAIEMRKKGYSLNEIACLLHVAKGSASLWLRDIEIDETAHKILLQKKQAAREKAWRVMKEKRELQQSQRVKQAILDLKNITFSKELYKLLTAIFIWTEGMKCVQSQLRFINSDPIMVVTFLKLIREGFLIDESKLRVLVHIHEYHNNDEIKFFWSSVTKIPLNQFHKSYLKPHTGKRIKEGYMGCVNINYFDSQVARQIKVLYNMFADTLTGGVV